MRATYRVLAQLIVAVVVVQVMVIAFGVFQAFHDVDDGHPLTKDTLENNPPAGLVLHSIIGSVVILLALILFISAFFAKVDQGVKFAGFVFLAVIVQVFLGIVSHAVPALGLLHGLNAFAVAGLAAVSARRAMGSGVASSASAGAPAV
jgi:hypothetical protein